MTPSPRTLFFLVVLLGIIGVPGCAMNDAAQLGTTTGTPEPARTAGPTPMEFTNDQLASGASDASGVANEYGIEVIGLSRSAAGYMLDFRYRVTDPDKAADFTNSHTAKPYLIDQETGAKFYVPNPPKIGPMRQTDRNVRTDRTYFILFGNPGRFIKAGDVVTLAMGEYRLKNLVVQ